MMMSQDDPLRHFHTDLSVGEVLRRARMKKGLAIEDLEVAIRVSAPHLKAIEEGKLEILPGRIYALGFIRAYAEYVGLDGDKIISLLKRQSGEKIAPKNITPALAPILEDIALPTGRMFLLLFGLLVLALSTQTLFHGHYTSLENIPAVPNDLKGQMTLLTKQVDKKTESLSTTESNAESPQPTTDILQPSKQIVLKAIDNVWLEIRDINRKTVFSRVLAVGEEYWIPPDQTGLVMTLGNAGGLQIVVDGENLPFLGRTGQVIRNVALNHDKLKQNLKTEPKKAM
jgi:transcriptional regulator with XRE-family HTH domain